jgi:hypothetical protein
VSGCAGDVASEPVFHQSASGSKVMAEAGDEAENGVEDEDTPFGYRGL